MVIRHGVELGIAIFLILIAELLRRHMKRKLDDIETTGIVKKKKDLLGKVIHEYDEMEEKGAAEKKLSRIWQRMQEL